MTIFISHLELRHSGGIRLMGPFNLALRSGERVALVGESGSGKSLLVQALFGVLPSGVRQAGGRIEAFGTPMEVPSPARDAIRGRRLAWVPQDPLAALNPFLSLRDHLALLPRIHLGESRSAALRRLAPLLERLRLAPDLLRRFPHEVSGGQRQRVALAMALSCDPELLILDEPTSSQDPALQREFVSIMQGFQTERNLGWLWITHDLELAEAVADRVVVLYGGESLEAGPADRVLQRPAHPYTQRLLSAARGEASSESGYLEAPERREAGCPFLPRCPQGTPRCQHWGPWQGSPEDGVRCEFPQARTATATPLEALSTP